MAALWGRLSLQDCDAELIIPPPTAVLEFGNAAPVDIVRRAIESGVGDITNCYIGETVFLLAVIRGPASQQHTFDQLNRAVKILSNVRVSLLRGGEGSLSGGTQPANDVPLVRRLSILEDSGWIGGRTDGQDGVGENEGRKVIYRGLWVLLKAPTAQSNLSGLTALTGQVRLAVTMREIAALDTTDISMDEAINLAARLSGPANVLQSIKSISVHLPLELNCRCITSESSRNRLFIAVSARNLTNHMNVAVVPPHVRLEATKVVSEPSTAETAEAVDGTPESLDLEELYEFKMLFSIPGRDTEDDVELEQNLLGGLFHGSDYSVFGPEFASRLNKTINLKPRECFDFVFTVKAKNFATHRSDSGLTRMPRLEAGCELCTDIVVGWRAYVTRENNAQASPRVSGKRQAERDSKPDQRSNEQSLSKYAVEVATRVLAVRWLPSELVQDVIINFSGPQLVCVDKPFDVEITILNQSREKVNAAMLFIQKTRPRVLEQCLIPLRSTTFLGMIDCGAMCTVKISCVSYFAGVVNLRDVSIVDVSPNEGFRRNVWKTDVSFETFALESNDPIWDSVVSGNSKLVIDQPASSAG